MPYLASLRGQADRGEFPYLQSVAYDVEAGSKLQSVTNHGIALIG
jgi:hypothetical protein